MIRCILIVLFACSTIALASEVLQKKPVGTLKTVLVNGREVFVFKQWIWPEGEATPQYLDVGIAIEDFERMAEIASAEQTE